MSLFLTHAQGYIFFSLSNKAGPELFSCNDANSNGFLNSTYNPLDGDGQITLIWSTKLLSMSTSVSCSRCSSKSETYFLLLPTSGRIFYNLFLVLRN